MANMDGLSISSLLIITNIRYMFDIGVFEFHQLV